MANLNLKGIWIPIEILTNKNLSDKEKIIYSVIMFLSKDNGYCYFTNSTISKLLDISTTQASIWINSLKKKGYIQTQMIYKENSKQIETRKIIPVFKNDNTYLRKVKYASSTKFGYPIQEKLKDNKYNKNISNKYNSDRQKENDIKANFDQRGYTAFDFYKLYSN